MDRLEVMMQHAKIHSLAVDDLTAPEDSEEEDEGRIVGVKAAQDRLKSIQLLYGTPSKSPTHGHPPLR